MLVKLQSKNKKVALGMSGGVDSSVAAFLLKEAGYDVHGFYMTCWDSKADGCRADEDRVDALKVATSLNIPFKALDFQNEYRERVIGYFYSEYEDGRTPNPDVMCNKEIKFGLFFDYAMNEGFDFISTGHYSRVSHEGNCFRLLMGIDESKDQSYFLYRLNQDILSKTLFPVGGFPKSKIREIANTQNLYTKSKPDSMGICFIGEVDIKEFLLKKLPINPGNVVDKEGRIIGSHDGVWFYTIGQRHGFKLSKYFGVPLYVISKNVSKNELVVGFIKDTQVSNFKVSQLNFICDKNLPSEERTYNFRIRHLGKFYPGKIKFSSNDSISISLDYPAFGVASGQSCVIYENNNVVGGGIIS